MPNLDETTRHSLTPAWDLTQERTSLESALGQRFNTFLIFFSVVVLAAVSARSRGHLLLVLSVGAVITLGLASSLLRTHLELDSVLKQLSAEPTHPVSILNDGQFGTNLNWITGWLLPFGCTFGLFLATAAAYQGSLTPGNAADLQLGGALNQAETLRQEVGALKAELAQANLDLKALRMASVDKTVRAPKNPTPPSAPARKVTTARVPGPKPDPKVNPKRAPPARAKPTPSPRRP